MTLSQRDANVAADCARTLQIWARLAGPVKRQLEGWAWAPKPSFSSSFAGLIGRATALRETEYRELSAIVRQSDECLSPLGEPLKQNIGLNRWLKGAREEAYSDWLQWLFAQMTLDDLFEVFSLPKLAGIGPLSSARTLRVDREVWVEWGHENQSGRLDMFINSNDAAVVVVEVKIGCADIADTAKQAGYVKSIESDPEYHGRYKKFVMLVTAPDKGEVCGFQIRGYSRLCRNLRRFAIKLMGCGQMYVAAMTLTIASAIETNLLCLSLQRISFTPATLVHLKEFTRSSQYE